MSSAVQTSGQRLWRAAILAPDAAVRGSRAADAVARVSGAIFIVGGLVKFVLHGWELDAFRRFGLPAPEVLVIVIGALETAGGVLLLRRSLVAPVALALAVIMAVAVAVSGVGHGDVIPSLTLAPALLVAMIYLLARVARADGGAADGTTVRPGG
ncbi:MAG: DoxX family membrane protein [Solirubrobacteraceae bacterium]